MARPRKAITEQHIDRFAILLNSDDGQLLRSIATKKGIPPAVLARSILVSKLDSYSMSLSMGNSLQNYQKA